MGIDYSAFGVRGKASVLTGGARGIGRAYAFGLAQAGVNVVVADVDEGGGRETVAEIERVGGSAVYVKTDVSNAADCEAVAQRCVEEFGSLDILVNNAGIWGGLDFSDPCDISVELWNRIIAVNLSGMWMCAKAVIPYMERQGGGTIVNQSSIGAWGGPGLAHYCAAKGGVNALTKSLAIDLGPTNIRVNAIAPGVIATEATLTNVPEEMLDALLTQQCVKRKGTVEDLVGVLLFLVSDAAAYISAQVIVVDGGGMLH